MSLVQQLEQRARELGFERVGVAAATAADGFDRFAEWLDRGYAGEMDYLNRHREARRDPTSVLPEVRSVVMVAMSYNPGPQLSEQNVGRVARYAQGTTDYHDVLRERLNALLAWVQEQVPGCCGRGVVDTAPLLERDFARRAGLGWFGKNTMLIDRRLGSYFFLGALLLDVELPTSPPFEANHCGSCTACLDACPTNAFTGPGWLDARRCISYLTIELRGPIPVELRPGIGDWLFGCDVCQEVCPWNRKAQRGVEPRLLPTGSETGLDPLEVLGLTDEEFRSRFRGTALWRTKRTGLQRNAAVVLGNLGDRRALPALERLRDDPDAGVREAVRWAIERLLESRSCRA